jgi:hypothetical protein
MKQTLQIFLSVTALSLSSCDSSKQDQSPAVDVVVAVWDPSNPVDGAMKGDWDSQNADVYLDNRYLGRTPIKFTAAKRRELGLPEYRKIDIDDKRHWVTWDYNGGDSILIAHPESPESKKRLHFRTTTDPKRDVRSQGVKITGISGPEPQGGEEVTMWLMVAKESSEQAGSGQPATQSRQAKD